MITGGVINGTAQFIIAGKNYKSYEDLRGATFGTASLSGGTITALRAALKVKGLEYPRDYKLLIVADGSSANLAALQSGHRRHHCRCAAELYRRRSRVQHHQANYRRCSQFLNQRRRNEALMGGKKSAGDGAIHEGSCAGAALAARE